MWATFWMRLRRVFMSYIAKMWLKLSDRWWVCIHFDLRDGFFIYRCLLSSWNGYKVVNYFYVLEETLSQKPSSKRNYELQLTQSCNLYFSRACMCTFLVPVRALFPCFALSYAYFSWSVWFNLTPGLLSTAASHILAYLISWKARNIYHVSEKLFLARNIFFEVVALV